MSFCHMRIARPVSELDTTASIATGWDSSCSAALPIMKDSAG
ncbi:prolyl endopeptidase [Klebsiella pneumoniae]|nr:prolyl endopeptidase [Klebsiella pneumoniae]